MKLNQTWNRLLRTVLSATLMFPHAVPAGLAVWTLMSLPVLSGVVVSSHAASPQMIDFQGRLTDASNNPRTGTYSIVFRIFDAVTAGNQLWTETQGSVDVQNGFFSVQLGASAPIPLTAFTAADAYLEIVVAGETLSPRQQLLSSPFAFTLLGRTTDYFVSTGAVNQSIAGSKYFTGTVGVGTTSLNAKFHVAATNDQIVMEDTDGGTDAKKWLIKSDGGLFEVVAANDAFDGFSAAMQVNRNGTGITRVAFPNGSVGVGTFFPDARLHVSSAAGTIGPQVIVSTGSTKIFEVNGASVGVNVPLYFADGSAQTTAFVSGSSVQLTSTQTWSGQNAFLNEVTVSSHMTVSHNPSSTNSQVEVDRKTLGTTGTAASGIGAYTSYQVENSAGNNLEAGRLGFLLRDATSPGTPGGEFTVSTWRDSAGQEGVWEVLSAYVDGSNKFICGNSSRENGPDCFGFTIGTGNDVALSYDGTSRVFWNYGTTANTFETKAASGSPMKFTTLGNQNIYFDASNDGTDLHISTFGNVGVGTSNPISKFQTFSAAGAGETLMIVSTGTTKIFEVTGSSVVINASSYTVINGGLVSIGTLGVPSSVSVIGTIAADRVTSQVALYQAAISARVTSTGDMADGFGPTVRFDIQDTAGVINNIAHIGAVRSGADNTGDIILQTTAAGSLTEKMRVTSGGNVGIGTAVPASLGSGASPKILQLHNTGSNAYGYLALSGDTVTSGEVMGILEFGTTGASNTKRAARISSWLSASGSTDATGHLRFETNNAGTFSEKVRIAADGNVGIGSTGPTAKLDVVGLVQASSASFTTTGSAATNIGLRVSSSSYLSSSGGLIGIGTTNPVSMIDIVQSASSYKGNGIRMAAASMDLRMFAESATVGAGYIGTESNHSLRFFTNGASGVDMTIDANGNVGIATLSPNGRLHVQETGTSAYGANINATSSSYGGQVLRLDTGATGSGYSLFVAYSNNGGDVEFHLRGDGEAYADGSWSGGGADVAENYFIEGAFEPGDLVQTVEDSPLNMGDKLKRHEGGAYHPKVVGVISTDPGLVAAGGGGEGAYTGEPVALAGRVPVKVSLEGGPIRAGDPLTSSSVPGVAMKAAHSGVIVGVALENYDGKIKISKGVKKVEADRLEKNKENKPIPEPREPGVGKIMLFVNATYTDPSGEVAELKAQSLAQKKEIVDLKEKMRMIEKRLGIK